MDHKCNKNQLQYIQLINNILLLIIDLQSAYGAKLESDTFSNDIWKSI
jgi:uncharacterized membrane protein